MRTTIGTIGLALLGIGVFISMLHSTYTFGKAAQLEEDLILIGKLRYQLELCRDSNQPPKDILLTTFCTNCNLSITNKGKLTYAPGS